MVSLVKNNIYESNYHVYQLYMLLDFTFEKDIAHDNLKMFYILMELSMKLTLIRVLLYGGLIRQEIELNVGKRIFIVSIRLMYVILY